MAKHYDGPIEMFEAMLGPQLLYSSGLWSDPMGNCTATDLAVAEINSVAQLISTIERRSETISKVLDVGCGWGALSIAARGLDASSML